MSSTSQVRVRKMCWHGRPLVPSRRSSPSRKQAGTAFVQKRLGGVFNRLHAYEARYGFSLMSMRLQRVLRSLKASEARDGHFWIKVPAAD